jgi:hypothetical protein
MELRTTKYFIQCLLISEKSWAFSSVTEYDKVPLQEFIIHVRIHSLLPPFNNFCVKTSLPHCFFSVKFTLQVLNIQY